MKTFVMFTQLSESSVQKDKPIVLDINMIESIAPRFIMHPEDRAKPHSEKRWVEKGTWITMAGSSTGPEGEANGTYTVTETFDDVLIKVGARR